MTTYVSGSEIYAGALREKLKQLPEISSVLVEIRELRQLARQERARAAEPGFQGPFVSYIPAYGVEDQVQALVDYCRLKRLLDRSKSFASFIATSVRCPVRWRCERAARGNLFGST